MELRSLLRLGLLLWSAVFIYSFVGGSGVAGVSNFLAFQIIAGVLAIGLWFMAGRFEKASTPRRAGRIPGLVFIAMLVALGLFYLTTGMVRPAFSGQPSLVETPQDRAV